MLFKIASRNIRKSWKIYIIYLVTLTLAVSLFYSFSALGSSILIEKLSSTDSTTFTSFYKLLMYLAGFISLFLIFLIAYANSSFIKIRSKELFVYKSLGMSSRMLTLIFILENIIIGSIAYLGGILLGTGLNIVLSNYIIKFMNLGQAKINPIPSIDNLVLTAGLFGVMLTIVMFKTALSVNNKQLIDLKVSKQKSVEKKVKLVPNIIIFIFSNVCLVLAYIIAYKANLNFQKIGFGFSIWLGFFAMIAVYYSMSNIIYSAKSRTYYQGYNQFQQSSLRSRIRLNKFGMGLISVAIFVIFTALITAGGILPMLDFEVSQADATIFAIDDSDLNHYLDSNSSSYQYTIVEQDEIYGMGNINNQFAYFDTVVLDYDTYSKLATFWGIKPIESSKPLFFENKRVVSTDSTTGQISDLCSSTEAIESISGKDSLQVITDNELDKYYPVTNVLVVNNQQKQAIQRNSYKGTESPKKGQYVYSEYWTEANIKYTGDTVVGEQAMKEIKTANPNLQVTTRVEMTTGSALLQLFAIFIAIFIGVTLLIIVLALLAIQQTVDSIENKQNYRNARLIGLTEDEQSKIIRKNTISYFMYPLIYAIISSIASVIIVDHFTSTSALGGSIIADSGVRMAVTFIGLIAIYVIYLCLTVYLYNLIITEE